MSDPLALNDHTIEQVFAPSCRTRTSCLLRQCDWGQELEQIELSRVEPLADYH